MDLDQFSEWTQERAHAAIARWNVLFPLEDNSAWKRVLAEAKERQVVLSLEMGDLDETALESGDVQRVALKILFLHAKWLREEQTIRLLQAARRENEEAVRFLESVKAQDKER